MNTNNSGMLPFYAGQKVILDPNLSDVNRGMKHGVSKQTYQVLEESGNVDIELIKTLESKRPQNMFGKSFGGFGDMFFCQTKFKMSEADELKLRMEISGCLTSMGKSI